MSALCRKIYCKVEFVERHRIVETDEQCPCLRLDACLGGVLAAERPNGIARLPQGHGDEFHTVLDFTVHQPGTAIAGDSFQDRHDRLAEKLDVGLGIVPGGQGPPFSNDHASRLLASRHPLLAKIAHAARCNCR